MPSHFRSHPKRRDEILQKIKKRKRIENFEIQSLREIVKENKEDVVERFENKFKEIRVEGKR